MKKTKIGLIGAFVLITIITIIVTLLLTSTISIGGGSKGEWKALWNGGSNLVNGNLFLVSDVTVSERTNIYCIEHGGMLKSTGNNYYYVSAVVTLTGHELGKGWVKYYGKTSDKFGFGSNEGINERCKTKSRNA